MHQAHNNTAQQDQGIAQRVPDDESDSSPATVTDIDTRQIRRNPSSAACSTNMRKPPSTRKTACHLPNPIFERDRYTAQITPSSICPNWLTSTSRSAAEVV